MTAYAHHQCIKFSFYIGCKSNNHTIYRLPFAKSTLKDETVNAGWWLLTGQNENGEEIQDCLVLTKS